MKKNEILPFEKAIMKLEEIVAELEKEDIPLDKAISYYQEGMKLAKQCDEQLKSAEEKMTQIIQDENNLEPFHIQEES